MTRGAGGDIAPEDRGWGVSRVAGSGVRDSARGPRARLLLSGTRIQGRTAEGGEDGPGRAGLDPGAHRKMTKGPRRREVGEHGRASICVQPPRTSPSGRASVLTLSTPWILASPLWAEGPGWGPQVMGSETPLVGEQPSPGIRRGCGAEDQTQATWGWRAALQWGGRGKAAAVRRRPLLSRDQPNTAAVVPTRAGVHPGRGALGAMS